MPTPVKFFAPLRLDLELRERARREGRTISDVALRAVERGLAASSPVEMPEGVVDRVERGSQGSKSVAAYLSPPLSGAIQRLAHEQNRSASWIMRSLIRDALRQRGLLPTPEQREGIRTDNRATNSPA
jgi:predicted transcriptional regulator